MSPRCPSPGDETASIENESDRRNRSAQRSARRPGIPGAPGLRAPMGVPTDLIADHFSTTSPRKEISMRLFSLNRPAHRPGKRHQVRPRLDALEDRRLLSITEFPTPTSNAFLNGITTGPDGNLWF